MNIQILRFLSVAIFCFFFNKISARAQEVPADLKFITLHTPHFDVVINAEQQSLGQFYANQLEKVYSFTSTFISEHPEKTVVIINDKWDVTNGYATRVPYPHIMVYPVLAGPQDSLADTGDWTLELLAHEYTHILSFEPAPGVMKPLRKIFGSILAPNILLPTWWKEGVAVQVESMISNGGRLRSAYQDAVIRAEVLTDSLKKNEISDINEVNPTWPEGMRSYLFGSLAWSQMVADQGDIVINRLFQRHGGRAPYFIEAAAVDNLGLGYPQEYRKALYETQNRALQQIDTLQKAPVTVDTPLVLRNAEIASSPSLSSDGQFLALISKSEIEHRSVRIFKKNPVTHDFVNAEEILHTESESEQSSNSKIYDGPASGSISRVSWFHQSQQLVYDKIELVNPIERYSDLYVFNLQTKKTEQISFQLRAREPAVSPDDQKIVFIKLGAQQTSLGLFDLATKKAQILVAGIRGQRLSFPVFKSDHEILYNSKLDSQTDEVWLYDLTTQSTKKISQNLKQARFPLVTKDGLLMTSSQNGVHNIYMLSENGKTAKPLTNNLTSYFSMAADPTSGDIYSTKMTDKGPWIFKIPAQQLHRNSAAALPVVQPLFADRYPARDAGPATEVAFPVEDYHAGTHLWPQYWIPFIATSNKGVITEILTSGFDPLRKHEYSLNVSWDSYLQKGSFTGLYQNNVWALPWFLQSSVTNLYFASASDYQTTSSYLTGVSLPVFSLSPDLTVTLAAKQIYFETPTVTYRGYGPTLNLSYVDVTKAGTQISPEQSKSFTLSATQYLKNGDDLSHSQYLTSASYYLNKFLPARHAIMFKINGAYTPEKIASSLGAATNSLALSQDTVGPQFLMRGYLAGHFVGRNMINSNIEYRFPLREIYRGSGTDPFYIRRLHGAFILDGVSTDGVAYNSSQKKYLATTSSEKYWGFGGELRLETTVGYVLPIQFVAYYYMPQNRDVGGDSSVGFTIQLTQAF